MHPCCNRLKEIFWFLNKEVTLLDKQGLYSQVRVTKRGNRVNLYTGGNYLQTTVYGLLTSMTTFFGWYLVAPWFSGKFNGELDSMLILGLGGGSQVKYYNQLYTVKKITGVELDRLIIEASVKYFELTDPNLSIVNADAYKYVETTDQLYDLIIIDLFKENKCENDRQTYAFLTTVKGKMHTDGVLFINKLCHDVSNPQLANDLVTAFKYVYTVEVFETTFFVATDSPTAPKNLDELLKMSADAREYNPILQFLRLVKSGKIKIIQA